jgi:hypothetical protein
MNTFETMVRALILFALELFSAGPAFAQPTETTKFTLYREGSRKPVLLKKGRAITVDLIDTISSVRSEITARHSYSGLLEAMDTTSLTLIQGSEEEYYSSETITCSVWTHHELIDSNWRQTIPLDQIALIRQTIRLPQYGAYIGGLSFLTAVIIAPLICMNYQEGTFNGEKYLSIVKPCLIGGGVAILLNLGGSERRLVVSPLRNQ